MASVQSIRAREIRLGMWIEGVTIGWMLLEATIALMAGFAARSVSLQGFGMDSVIELLTGSILLWRLGVEQRDGSLDVIARAERRAAGVTALSLFALSLYLVGESIFTLLTGTRPGVSWWGLALAFAAVCIMPLLWQGKLRLAKRIGSVALKADAACSVTCAYMSLALLLGLLLNRLFGWWWADPLSGLALVYFLLREGREAWHEARTGETCHCGEDGEK